MNLISIQQLKLRSWINIYQLHQFSTTWLFLHAQDGHWWCWSVGDAMLMPSPCQVPIMWEVAYVQQWLWRTSKNKASIRGQFLIGDRGLNVPSRMIVCIPHFNCKRVMIVQMCGNTILISCPFALLQWKSFWNSWAMIYLVRQFIIKKRHLPITSYFYRSLDTYQKLSDFSDTDFKHTHPTAHSVGRVLPGSVHMGLM